MSAPTTTPPEHETVPAEPADRRLPATFDDDDAPVSPYEPVGVVPRYPPPRATIDPDRSKGWIRRVMPVVLAHRSLLVVSLITALIALVAQVAVPGVVRAGIDNALIDKTSELEPFAIAIIVLGVTRALMSFVYRFGLYRMAYLIETDLRSIIYRHLTRLSFSFYDRIQSGQVISRANSDIRSVQMFLAFFPMIAMTVISFVVAFGFMLTINVPLTLMAIAPLPFVYVTGVQLRHRIFPLSWVIQSRMADVATIVDENVNGVRVVKSFAAEEQQIGVLSRAARRLQWATVRQADARAHFAPFMENLPRLGMVAVLVYGGWLVIEGQLQLGTLVAFNAYILMLQAPFRLLGFFLMLGQRAAASAERIYEILDEQPEIVDRPDAVDLSETRGEVELRNVTFSYGDGPPVLDRLDLHIQPGEAVAIVGRTGSGKSTIARLVPRFYDVDTGAVLVDGHDVRDLSVLSLRAQVGLVLDEPFLFSVSVRDNIAYARPDATMEEVEEAARAARAHDFIERLPEGYETVIGERGYTLSGGQRQRVAIARTLLVNPRILVLDDATSAIDVKIESEIHDALVDLMRDRTTIVIAHRLSTISLATRVVLIEGGRIVASGTHAELMATDPRYAEVLARAEEETPDEPADGDAQGADEDDISYRRRIAASVMAARGPGGAGPAADLGGGIGGLGS
jgi:ATP-binding cassette subfamily B protein